MTDARQEGRVSGDQKEAIVEANELFEIGNEFALVRVRRIRTRNGHRLEITSPKLQYQFRLDPLELESLTWQAPDTFARMLEHPYGHREGSKREGGKRHGSSRRYGSARYGWRLGEGERGGGCLCPRGRAGEGAGDRP